MTSDVQRKHIVFTKNIFINIIYIVMNVKNKSKALTQIMNVNVKSYVKGIYIKGITLCF